MTRSIGMVCGKCYKCMGSEENFESSAEFLYIYSRACVRVGNDVSECFPGNVELRLGCVMSPLSFQTNNSDLLEKDGGTKNFICKD